MDLQKIFAITFFLCLFSAAYTQTNRQIHIDIGLLQNHGGFFKLYDGILEIGGDYSLGLSRDLYAGIAMHGGFLNRSNEGAHAIFYKPSLKLSYLIHLTERIAVSPGAGIGYTWIKIRNDGYGYNETQSGMNTGVDLRFIWKTKERTDFYIFGRYNYIYLNEDRQFTELEYYRNINQTVFGFGISLK